MENIPPSESIQYPKIATEINEMAETDQAMRKRQLVEDDYWDDIIDKNNSERMKQIIDEISWPTVSKVGKVASHNAWLLVQHADHDIEFQKQCLVLMEGQSAGEVELRDIAYLTDRIEVHEGHLQVYGTQFKTVDGISVPQDIENIEEVDKRRADMGLPSLAEGIEEMNQKYKK